MQTSKLPEEILGPLREMMLVLAEAKIEYYVANVLYNHAPEADKVEHRQRAINSYFDEETAAADLDKAVRAAASHILKAGSKK